MLGGIIMVVALSAELPRSPKMLPFPAAPTASAAPSPMPSRSGVSTSAASSSESVHLNLLIGDGYYHHLGRIEVVTQ